MSPLIQFRNPRLPYHFTVRTIDKRTFPLEQREVWREFSHILSEYYFCHSVRVHAFVLMNNHFHLLFTSTEFLPQLFAQQILNSLGIKLNLNTDYFLEKIENRYQYKLIYKYLYRNPVSAGIVDRVEKYPFSTLPVILGRQSQDFPVFDNMGLITNSIRCLDWLNSPMPPQWSCNWELAELDIPTHDWAQNQLKN